PPPPRTSLCPYTTLFRSSPATAKFVGIPPASTVSGAEAAIMMKTSDAVDNRRRSSFVGSMEEPPKGEEYLYCGSCHEVIDWLRAHDDWSTVPKRPGPERISARDLVISWSC